MEKSDKLRIILVGDEPLATAGGHAGHGGRFRVGGDPSPEKFRQRVLIIGRGCRHCNCFTQRLSQAILATAKSVLMSRDANR